MTERGRRDKELATRDERENTLSDVERKLVNEAIERGRKLHTSMDQLVIEYGQWLFQNVFGGDTRSAIDHRGDNALWLTIFEAADSVRLRLNEQLVEDAVLCAAYDKRLNSDGWRSLDFARKSRLLRLGDEKLMRKGAAHVLATNLNAKRTAEYVRSVLAEVAHADVPRRVDVRRVGRQFDTLADKLEDKGFLRHLESNAKKLDDEQRETVVERVARLRAALDEIERRLR